MSYCLVNYPLSTTRRSSSDCLNVSVYGAYLLFQLWSHEYLYQSPVTRSEPLGINLVPSVRLPALNKFPYHSMKGFKRRHPEKTGLDPTSLELGESSRPSAVAMTDRTDSSASDVTLISRTSSAAAETERSQSKFDIEQGQMSTISALSVGSGPTVRLLPDDGISSPRSTQGSSYSTASYSPRHTGPSDDSEWGKVPMQMQMSDSVSSVNSVQEHEAASTTSVPKLGCALNIALLVTVTVVSVPVPWKLQCSDDSLDHLQVVAFVADQLVESMDEISVHVDKTWIGLILLPSVSAIAGEFPFPSSKHGTAFAELKNRVHRGCQGVSKRSTSSQYQRCCWVLHCTSRYI